MAVVFFGGMFIPVTLFPHGVEIVASFVPTALGVTFVLIAVTYGLVSAFVTPPYH